MKNKHKKIIIFTMILFIFLFGCSKSSNADEAVNTMSAKLISEDEKPYIGFLLDALEYGGGATDKEVIEKSVAELGGVIKTLAANKMADIQYNQAKLLIEEGVDILVIEPYDATLAGEIVTLAHEAGIKVVSYDRLIKDVEVDYYVTYDSYKVGQMQAAEIVKTSPTGKFVYIGGSELDNNAHLLKEGAMSILQPYIDAGDIELVYESFTDKWDGKVAKEKFSLALKQLNNKVDGVIAANDTLAGAIIEELDRVGLAGKVPVSGQDSKLDAVRRVMNGTQTMTVYKASETLAYEAAQIAVAIAKGENMQLDSSMNNGKINVPAVMLEPVIVTKETVEETIIKSGIYTTEDILTK